MKHVAWKRLLAFGARYLEAKGVPRPNARHVAETAVMTEAYGVTTHGVRVFFYFERMVGTEIDPKAEPRLVRETGATALIDGNRAFGQLAMKLATEIATRKAKEQGVAMVAVRDSFWLGALAVYMIPPAEAGFLAQLWVQHSSGRDCAPFGGIEPRFSTNPFALAFPTGQLPMISDFSTAVIAMGKVLPMIDAGKRFDEELFIDRSGKPTNDPRAMREGGSMLPTGGAKHGYRGYALSLWSEALTAAAGGRCNDPDSPPRQSFNLTVIDPEAFAGSAGYRREMKRFLAWMRTSRLRPGFTEIRLPGERGLKSLAKARKAGIPLEDEVIGQLNELARKNGLAALETI